MSGALDLSYHTSKDCFCCLVKYKNKYYLVSFLHVVILNNTLSSLFIIWAKLNILLYKDKILAVLHHPINLYYIEKELISTFNNKNLKINLTIWLIILFLIITQILWKFFKFLWRHRSMNMAPFTSRLQLKSTMMSTLLIKSIIIVNILYKRLIQRMWFVVMMVYNLTIIILKMHQYCSTLSMWDLFLQLHLVLSCT